MIALAACLPGPAGGQQLQDECNDMGADKTKLLLWSGLSVNSNRGHGFDIIQPLHQHVTPRHNTDFAHERRRCFLFFYLCNVSGKETISGNTCTSLWLISYSQK